MKKKLFGLLTSVACTAVAVPFLLASNKQATKVSATASEKIIYVDLSLNTKFLEEGANPYLHFNDETINLTLVSNDIYQSVTAISISNITSGFAVSSFNGTFSTVSVDSDILSKDYYNYICVDSYVSDSEDVLIDSYGYYGEKTNNPDPTYKTHRVWLHDSGVSTKDSWGNGLVNAAIYLDELSWKLTIMKDVYNKDGKIYYCVDVPINVTSIHFIKLSGTDNHNYSIYRDIIIESITYGICYYLNELGYTYGSVFGADAYLLSEVVQAYLTYGDKPCNGTVKSTVKSLYSTWFANKDASDDQLKSIKIWDYTGYAANHNSYEGLEKNAQFSVNEKWNTMCAQAGIDPRTGDERNDFLAWFTGKNLIIVIAVVAAIVLAGGFTVFLIIKKKRAS